MSKWTKIRDPLVGAATLGVMPATASLAMGGGGNPVRDLRMPATPVMPTGPTGGATNPMAGVPQLAKQAYQPPQDYSALMNQFGSGQAPSMEQFQNMLRPQLPASDPGQTTPMPPPGAQSPMFGGLGMGLRTGGNAGSPPWMNNDATSFRGTGAKGMTPPAPQMPQDSGRPFGYANAQVNTTPFGGVKSSQGALPFGASREQLAALLERGRR